MEDLNIERVRDMLHARLGDRGIDVDQVYINGVYSLQDPQVIYSQTLVWALFLKFQEGKVPQFKSNHMGIFSELIPLKRCTVSKRWILTNSTVWLSRSVKFFRMNG